MKIRILLGALVLNLYFSASYGSAILYKNRINWENAATATGLSISTETFSTSPTFFGNTPSSYEDPIGLFEVGRTTWNILNGEWDSDQQQMVQDGGSYDMFFDLGSVSKSVSLFGFGFEVLEPVGRLKFVDKNNDRFEYALCCEPGTGVPTSGFIGILSDQYIVPSDLYKEIHLSGSYYARMDNVSVAVSNVPAPPALLLFGTGLLGLIGFSRRKEKA